MGVHMTVLNFFYMTVRDLNTGPQDCIVSKHSYPLSHSPTTQRIHFFKELFCPHYLFHIKNNSTRWLKLKLWLSRSDSGMKSKLSSNIIKASVMSGRWSLAFCRATISPSLAPMLGGHPVSFMNSSQDCSGVCDISQSLPASSSSDNVLKLELTHRDVIECAQPLLRFQKLFPLIGLLTTRKKFSCAN